ncbi:hypothetical protein [Acinetobacter proteolyticus]|uniref:hypothetical protein n=1 Tax=Acinetobacter proteolyticus TaxID=1776741 RepID=UPI003D965F4E
MNIFEGSRRISYIIGVLAVFGTIIYAINYKPYISAKYSITNPNGEFIKMETECPEAGGRTFFSTSSKEGATIYIDLCMLPLEFENNNMLVPYKIDEENMLWGAEAYSKEITSYGKELEARFILPNRDNISFEKETSKLYWANWIDSLKFLALFLVLFYGLVWVVGWIVRGFMGIPQGQDRKPK